MDERWLVTFYLLFAMEFKTRCVNFADCPTNATETWVKQAAIELTAFDDGFLTGERYVLMASVNVDGLAAARSILL